MKKSYRVLGAILATFLWGSAFPCVKIGYQWFQIESSSVGSQMLFAGFRFLIAGLLVLVMGSIWSKRILIPRRENRKRSWKLLLILAVTQTFLQYFFYYIGLAHVTGSKGSIMNSLGTLFTVIMGMIVFRSKLSWDKILGVVLGMSGVFLACLSGMDGSMSLAGEGALFLSAISIAIGNIWNKKAASELPPMMVTGWHLFLGGLALAAVGMAAGGRLQSGHTGSWILFGYLIFISAAGFGIWSWLLKHNTVEQVAIFMFLTPIFGTILSAIFLQEHLSVMAVVALFFVSVGVFLENRK